MELALVDTYCLQQPPPQVGAINDIFPRPYSLAILTILHLQMERLSVV